MDPLTTHGKEIDTAVFRVLLTAATSGRLPTSNRAAVDTPTGVTTRISYMPGWASDAILTVAVRFPDFAAPARYCLILSLSAGLIGALRTFIILSTVAVHWSAVMLRFAGERSSWQLPHLLCHTGFAASSCLEPLGATVPVN